MGDEFRPVKGYEDEYQISRDGIVVNSLGKVKKPIERGTYKAISLSKNGKKKTFKIADLVSAAFNDARMSSDTFAAAEVPSRVKSAAGGGAKSRIHNDCSTKLKQSNQSSPKPHRKERIPKNLDNISVYCEDINFDFDSIAEAADFLEFDYAELKEAILHKGGRYNGWKFEINRGSFY